jgi:hypothetical protein
MDITGRKEQKDDAWIVMEYAKGFDLPESSLKFIINSIIEKGEQPGVEMPDLMQFLYDCKEELE